MNLTIVRQIIAARKRSIITVALLLFIATGAQLFISFFYGPKVEKLQEEWLKLRDQERSGAVLGDRNADFQQGGADVEKFRGRIYSKHEFVRFVADLYDVASKSGVNLASISYKPAGAKEEKLIAYSLSLGVIGNYAQLKRFIYELGSGKGNILVIESIGISSGDAESALVNLQVTVSAYFRPEGK